MMDEKKAFEEVINNIQTCDNNDLDVHLDGAKYFLQDWGICELILQQETVDKTLVNHVVKLHDIVSNAAFLDSSTTKHRPEQIAVHVTKNVLLALTKIKSHQNVSFLASVLSSCLLNYSHYNEAMRELVSSLTKAPLEWRVFQEMSTYGQSALLKAVLVHTENGQQVLSALNNVQVESVQPVFVKQLCSRLSHFDQHSRLICFLSLKLSHDKLAQLLVKTLSMWSDPVISRAHVSQEVIHYTKLSFVLLTHVPQQTCLAYKMQITEQMVRGLPNHFNSTDPRTVQLAKFFCEIVTETLKLYEERISDISDELKCPEMELSRDLLTSCHTCDQSKHFWATHLTIETEKAAEEENLLKDLKITDNNDEDDDDDDLEAIESLDALPQHNVTYIRDFLERLPELKTFDEMNGSLSSLPNVIRYQLAYEHPQVGRDLLDAVFRWENEFDSGHFDELRKRSLCTALKYRVDMIGHFCNYFHHQGTTVPKKSLVLDVLSRVSSDLALKDLQALAKCSFSNILQYDQDCLDKQEVPLRIPLILYFHRLLTALPTQLLDESMVTSYLRSLTRLTNVDSQTEQTICYSLHHLMDTLNGVQLMSGSQDVQACLSDTRSWLWRLQCQ